MLFAWMCAVPALADQYDTVNYTASVGAVYDDNIFRLPSQADPRAVIGSSSKSDWIKIVSLGIGFDKKYSRQEVMFNASLSNNKFSTFSNLDYNKTNYDAVWNWSLSSRLSGTLSFKRTQTLTNYANFHAYTRNLSTVNNRGLFVDWWLQSSWHVIAGVHHERSTYTVASVTSPSYFNRSREWGLRYTPGDGSSLSLISRFARGGYENYVSPDYFNLIDTGYTERQLEASFKWPLTGKSTLSGNLMKVRRRYPIFYQRNYSGTQGKLDWTWSMTGKTLLNLSADRTLTPWHDFASSYYVTDTVSLSPVWQATSKVSVRMTVSRGKADYFGPVIPNLVARHDNNRSEAIGVVWVPRRSLKLSAPVLHTRRTTNYQAYEYNDNSANLSLTAMF